MKSIVTRADLQALSVLPSITGPESLPISFLYGDTPVHGLPASFRTEVKTHTPSSRPSVTTFTGCDENGLRITVELTRFLDYPALSLVAFFTNTSSADTPILSNIKIFDSAVALPKAAFIHSNGDTLREDGYELWRDPLTKPFTLAPADGTSCNGAFPYFTLQGKDMGLHVAVGWPAVWQADLAPKKNGLTLSVGQKRCHMSLRPGETIRTPRVDLIAYTGSEERGVNLYRRWYIDHILPREDGQPLPPKCCMHVFGAEGKPEFTGASEENQLRGLNAYLQNGVRPDIWWIDAGWYPCNYEWPRIGTWQVDADRFPNGLRPIGEACAENDMRFLLWFEPERVRPGTELALEHPDWLLTLVKEDGSTAENMLLDLGNPAACDFIIDRVDSILKASGVTIYRQDFNFDPLPIWIRHEAPDRIGAIENHHVQGYLRYWDSLLARNPGLLIDSCASGGRRNDIETMRRAVPLHYTDVGYGHHPIKQKQHALMFRYIPYFRAHNMSWDDPATGEYASSGKPQDRFSYYCAMAPALTDMLEWDAPEADFALAREMQPIWRKAASMMLTCDHYALTECRKSRADYYAVQFHDPDDHHGFVELIRNNACAEPTFCLRMRALDPTATYILTHAETGAQLRLPGEALLTGVDFALPPRSGAIYFYQRTC